MLYAIVMGLNPLFAMTQRQFESMTTAQQLYQLYLAALAGGGGGFDPTAPGPIGATTPAAITGTTLAVTTLTLGGDVTLLRDAANIGAQRNGTTAQEFRVYNSYTDASNYYGASIVTGSGIVSIGQFSLGAVNTGGSRISFMFAAGITLSPGNSIVQFNGTTSAFPALKRSGTTLLVRLADDSGTAPLTAGAITGDSVTTIGGGNITSAGDVRIAGTNIQLFSPGVGILRMADASTGTTFNRLQFGGTSSSYPSLKRNLTAIDVRLADDSGYAPLAVAFIEGTEMTAPAAPAANGWRLFAQDNGSGKTQLMAIFATGAAQQVAIEP